jgi:hypothetical protein
MKQIQVTKSTPPAEQQPVDLRTPSGRRLRF